MTVVSLATRIPVAQQLKVLEHNFSVLQSAFNNDPNRSLALRLGDLKRLHKAILSYRQHLVSALSQDYGYRSSYETMLADILPSIRAIKHARRHLKHWMKPDKEPTQFPVFGRVEVHHQPLGVIGIMVPWNFPISLSLVPLVTALAAGNRVMIKASEQTPRTNEVLKNLLSEAFPDDQVFLVEGDLSMASAFCELPFSHLQFTGTGEVGKQVLRAASLSLTPVSLEFGGKSPVVITPDMPPQKATETLLFGKSLNSGQVCVAPDICYVHESALEGLIDALAWGWKNAYPQGISSRDWTSINSDENYQRLITQISDAKAKGARVIPLGDPPLNDRQKRMTLHLVINPPSTAMLMQEEVFGPILPVYTYEAVETVFEKLSAQTLRVLYLMSNNEPMIRSMLASTQSKAVVVNNTLVQSAISDALFGGRGASGIASYHGKQGFMTLSCQRTVFRQGRFNPGKLMQPPFRRWWQRLILSWLLR
ncbi:aldehyde dehydrogenase family protein [Veronia pacifica]|uniref:Aldehyde dehydrogenase n=1 Tax=Veronia pacifica TaxID=1080227 RepID=A0A1C3EJ25_9GAMM|nr:aldehyde dehydrogenase family protein [Veronia pacifica]ODA33242.1 coniferyl-aldehyde dehydrogenase [Veronia pacifica]